MTTQDILVRHTKKRGITESKKAELDLLTNQVIDAQYIVEQLQAMVAALSDKYQKFQGYLAVADANKTRALSNKNLMEQVVQNALQLRNNSGIAFDSMVLADAKTRKLATGINDVIAKLIYSAEVINKLSNTVIRKKAINPLISDELVSRVGSAGSDADNAVALTLVALNSTFAAQASNLESEAITALEYTEAMKLYEVLTGTDEKGQKTSDNATCIETLLKTAYQKASDSYNHAFRACKETLGQLNKASSDLTKAQVKLRSLQSGLAAANAAALAS